MIRRSLILPALATAVLSIAACSGGGSEVTNTTTPATSDNAASTSAQASDPLASLDPCSLLTSEQVSQLGLTPQGPKTIAGSRGCTWANPGYVIGIHFYEGRGLDNPNDGTGENTKYSLPGHDAVQSTKSGFGCGIEIAITTSSIVIAQISNEPNDCALAQQYATLIEPKLPAQQK